MEANVIIEKIKAAIPDAQVELTDLTGTKDHWQATIVSKEFTGKSMMQQHKMVYAALEEEMKGPIHALTLTTKAE